MLFHLIIAHQRKQDSREIEERGEEKEREIGKEKEIEIRKGAS